MTELWPPEPSRNPKGSSAQVEWHQGQIWELKDGRVNAELLQPGRRLESAELRE